jgi:predicted TIM-barrel fold metal-dependent hydrolase
LEPELPICDTHHHFWDLRPRSIPYQRYLVHELNADIYSDHNVQSTVFVEAGAMYRSEGPEEMRSVGEVEFVQGLAAASASGVYGPAKAAAAIVGRADLKLVRKVEPVLEALQAASPNRFRGIRHAATWSPDPTRPNLDAEHILAGGRFREGAAALAQKGMSLDTMVSFPQLPEVAEFGNALPDLTIILNHIGGGNRVGIYAGRDEEVAAEWRNGIAAVAACPNVMLKLGEMGMPRWGFGWHTRDIPVGAEEVAESMSPWMTYCIEKFGPERCMFESNFPPD